MRALLLRWPLRLLLAALLLAWLGLALWLAQKRLPPGLHISGGWEPVAPSEVVFRRDLSAADANGAPLSETQIDGELLRLIAQARDVLVLDTGLFGNLPAAGPLASSLRAAPNQSAQLSEALLRAKRELPGLQILLLTDPASLAVGGDDVVWGALRRAGIAVVAVDTARLRSPDAPFSALWRLGIDWWSRPGLAGAWPNPLGVGPAGLSLGLWGQLHDYQRSHRQLLIADNGNGDLTGLIFSRPLHTEASIHSATALRLAGAALAPLLESEFVVAQFSGWSGGGIMQARAQRLIDPLRRRAVLASAGAAARAQVLTEGAIAQALIQRLDRLGAGDSLDIAALYLSERDLVRAILDASKRGAAIRVLLDPGKDGYGFDRSGLPNRVVASELVAASDGAVRVRWYRTHGEQFSAGLVLGRAEGRVWLMIGTAELRRTDLDDLNLAAAFAVELPADAAAAADALSWFDTLWYNRAPGGIEYSSDADVYADASQWHYWQYRLLEASGVSFN